MAEQIAYNMDCMEYMKSVPDKYFDLAVVDPPYGSGANTAIEDPRGHFVGGHAKKYGYGITAATISVARTGGNGGGWTQHDKDIQHWDIAPLKTWNEHGGYEETK